MARSLHGGCVTEKRLKKCKMFESETVHTGCNTNLTGHAEGFGSAPDYKVQIERKSFSSSQQSRNCTTGQFWMCFRMSVGQFEVLLGMLHLIWEDRAAVTQLVWLIGETLPHDVFKIVVFIIFVSFVKLHWETQKTGHPLCTTITIGWCVSSSVQKFGKTRPRSRKRKVCVCILCENANSNMKNTNKQTNRQTHPHSKIQSSRATSA